MLSAARITITFCIGLITFPCFAQGSEEDPTGQVPVIQLDLNTRLFSTHLPFDQKFQIRGKVDANIKKVKLVIHKYESTGLRRCRVIKKDSNNKKRKVLKKDSLIKQPPVEYSSDDWKQDTSGLFPQDQFIVDITGKLCPEMRYKFSFEFYKTAESENAYQTIDIFRQPRVNLTDHFHLGIDILSNLKAPYWSAGTTLHMYFTPINRGEDLGEVKDWQNLSKRVSLLVGLSVVELSDQAEVNIKSGTSLGSPLFGLGIRGLFYWGGEEWQRRWFQPIRLNFGWIYVKQDHAHPLIEEDRSKLLPFVSLSADVQLKNIIGPLAGFFGSN